MRWLLIAEIAVDLVRGGVAIAWSFAARIAADYARLTSKPLELASMRGNPP